MKPSGTGAVVRVAIAGILMFSNSWFLNVFMLPVVDTVSPALRDITYILRGFVLVAIAAAAMRSARIMHGEWLLPCAYIIIGLGIVAGIAAWATNSAALIVLWFVLNTITTGLTYLLFGIACMTVSASLLAFIIPSAYAISIVSQAVSRMVFHNPPLALTTVASLVVLLLIDERTRSIFGQITTSISPSDAKLAWPQSFPSFLNQLFVCMFVFSAAKGLSLSFQASAGVPVDSLLTAIPLIILALYSGYLWYCKHDICHDCVVQIAFIISLAGMVFTLADPYLPDGLVNALLSAGSLFFASTSYCVLTVIAARNHLGAVRVFAMGNAALSFGVVVGAIMGRLLSGTEALHLPPEIVVGIAVVIFVGYFVYFLTHYSITSAIEEVKQADVVEAVEADRETNEGWEARVASIGQQYGLTPRECEIMELLARGRNGHFIADELGISYNTVKTHVAHVYDKLGVHSQQDVIGLLEVR